LDRGETEKDLDLFFVEPTPEIRNVQGCLDEILKLPEIHRLGSTHTGGGGPCRVIWFQDRKHHIDAQFRLLGARSLNATCPHCGASIPPDQQMRVDFEHMQCPKCEERFVPAQSRTP
jgi:hypothetical protein